jgi:hypothetical protein
MRTYLVARVAIVATLCGCAAQEPTSLTSPAALATGADAAAGRANEVPGDVPFRATGTYQITAVEYAGVPSVDRSTFGGRCSVPSDWVASGILTGTAAHLGNVTGTFGNCSQVTWMQTEGGPVPVASTYGDGQATLVAANGDVLTATYGDGVGTFGPSGGTLEDRITFVGGTGRFEGATGEAVEHGLITTLDAPIPFVISGTINYRR